MITVVMSVMTVALMMTVVAVMVTPPVGMVLANH